MIRGAIWFTVGASISLWLYIRASNEAAEDGSGEYFVLWGLMAYGAFRFLRGLYWYLAPQTLVDD
ncbi:MAG: hypothetical protein Q8K58_10825 [Acidimicrobiales bacterium]|nr:hypothetical protein [Acidimicrobiales bacterium]